MQCGVIKFMMIVHQMMSVKSFLRDIKNKEMGVAIYMTDSLVSAVYCI